MAESVKEGRDKKTEDIRKTGFWFLAFTYAKGKWRLFCAVLVLAFVFWFVFYLGGVPPESYGYAYLLAVFFLLLFLGWDFIRYRKKHMELLDIYDRINVELKGLPKADSLLESDYQAVLGRLYACNKEVISLEDARKKDMTDYYTLWAHQIKTPITALNLLIQAQEGGGKAELSQQLIKIERYVEMVLQYLRMENMSSDLRLREVKVKKLVNAAVKKDRTIFIHRKISLNLQDMENTVLTDEKWLVFVIEQILSNSLKYTDTGGSISVYMLEGEENTLVIEDNGMGIKEEDLPRIFENGFTGYNGRMEKKSTGIGLYLCRQILDKLGHSISVSSVPGRGTKVMIDMSRREYVEI
ncbi:sensor histidine kinase [Murimonas intestini]|uniref:histidine kinase n=1 Tax=Murimonas intestini TaxID=1337051 RepID=A0AB73T4Q9_9FIRM|nr:sensor histidine kinase [Murimonas intestini]MCR1840525.1 sensor histidine kinase [Murimonas intestini]MCR1865421.1 sensor histidine kinase [Murimonas intestini]MCR1882868.1 sensor histidine kinase [Murimonas intestini]